MSAFRSVYLLVLLLTASSVLLVGCDLLGNDDDDEETASSFFGVQVDDGLNVGTTTEGTLSSTDARLSDFDEGFGAAPTSDDTDSFVDVYQLNVGEGANIRLTLTSNQFDPFLFLVSESGEILGLDDDSAGNFNSQLTTRLDSGTYFIVASSFRAGETGNYELAVDPENGGGDLATYFGVPIEDSITPGESIDAALRTTDARLSGFNEGFGAAPTNDDTDSFVDVYQMNVDADATVAIDHVSATFDSYLYLA
jgi:hypothetical protein